MLDLATLSEFAARHGGGAPAPVQPFVLAGREVDTDARPVVMGCVNLSRDSTYRESVAPTPQAAARKVLVQLAQGADLVDLGLEATSPRARRVDAHEQVDTLVPVLEAVGEGTAAMSVETFEPAVAEAALRLGVRTINFTGAQTEGEIYALAAAHDAAVVICYSPGLNVRGGFEASLDVDPVPHLLEHFAPRVEAARAAGVRGIAVDPGVGFHFSNVTDPLTRIRYQSKVLLHSLRLRAAGVPVCQALPHAFDVFEDQFRSAESFYAVLARLGGNGVLRTHEVPLVVSTLRAMRECPVV